MLSSICVSTTTGLPAARAVRRIRRWIVGTSSAGISTPRSPRATMTASAPSMIASRCSIADGFSSLAMTFARPPDRARTSATSSGRCTKDSATQSTPRSSAKARSMRSLSVRADSGSTAPTMLTPLRSSRRPPVSTRAVAVAAAASSTTRRSLPSSIRSSTPGASAAKTSGCGRGILSPSASSAKRTRSPVARSRGPPGTWPMRSFGPCRSARMPIGLPVARSSSRMMPWRA